jgi:hypothetical protein
MEEKKRGGRKKWIILVLILIMIMIVLAYFFLIDKNGSSENAQMVVLTNPIVGLSDEQAIAQFNESFVLYLLASIGAQKLHKVPLGSEPPKIEVYIDEMVFSAIIDKGAIGVGKGNIVSPDIRIKTSKIEGVKMLRNRSYINRSFENGNSKIELVAGKATLFGKGYLDLYKEVTGKSVTGSFLK